MQFNNLSNCCFSSLTASIDALLSLFNGEETPTDPTFQPPLPFPTSLTTELYNDFTADPIVEHPDVTLAARNAALLPVQTDDETESDPEELADFTTTSPTTPTRLDEETETSFIGTSCSTSVIVPVPTCSILPTIPDVPGLSKLLETLNTNFYDLYTSTLANAIYIHLNDLCQQAVRNNSAYEETLRLLLRAFGHLTCGIGSCSDNQDIEEKHRSIQNYPFLDHLGTAIDEEIKKTAMYYRSSKKISKQSQDKIISKVKEQLGPVQEIMRIVTTLVQSEDGIEALAENVRIQIPPLPRQAVKLSNLIDCIRLRFRILNRTLSNQEITGIINSNYFKNTQLTTCREERQELFQQNEDLSNKVRQFEAEFERWVKTKGSSSELIETLEKFKADVVMPQNNLPSDSFFKKLHGGITDSFTIINSLYTFVQNACLAKKVQEQGGCLAVEEIEQLLGAQNNLETISDFCKLIDWSFFSLVPTAATQLMYHTTPDGIVIPLKYSMASTQAGTSDTPEKLIAVLKQVSELVTSAWGQSEVSSQLTRSLNELKDGIAAPETYLRQLLECRESFRQSYLVTFEKIHTLLRNHSELVLTFGCVSSMSGDHDQLLKLTCLLFNFLAVEYHNLMSAGSLLCVPNNGSQIAPPAMVPLPALTIVEKKTSRKRSSKMKQATMRRRHPTKPVSIPSTSVPSQPSTSFQREEEAVVTITPALIEYKETRQEPTFQPPAFEDEAELISFVHRATARDTTRSPSTSKSVAKKKKDNPTTPKIAQKKVKKQKIDYSSRARKLDNVLGLLRHHKYRLLRQCGSHATFRDDGGRTVTVPTHPGKLVHPKLLKQITEG